MGSKQSTAKQRHPSSSSSTAHSASRCGLPAEQYRRLQRFYQHYHLEVPAEEEIRCELQRFRSLYEAGRRNDLEEDVPLRRCTDDEGHIALMWKELTSVHGPEPWAEERRILRNVYATHAQHMKKTADQLETILERFQGNFSELFERLAKKFQIDPSEVTGERKEGGAEGGEGSPVTGAAPPHHQPPPPAYVDPRLRLERLIAQYDPSKADEIDELLAKWSGREADLIKSLVDLYGPEPEADLKAAEDGSSSACTPAELPSTPLTEEEAKENHRRRLRRYYDKYLPQKSDQEIEVALTKYGPSGFGPGGYDKMWSTLMKKYGPEPSGSECVEAPMPAPTVPAPSPPAAEVANTEKEHQRARLRRFYAKYSPEKTDSQIDQAIERYATVEGGYARMWSTLVTKYGPEPTAEQTSTDCAGTDAAAKLAVWVDPNVEAYQRARLLRYNAHYNMPLPSEEIDALLSRYSGSGEGYASMWKELETLYGPEPSNEHKERLRRFYAKYAPEKTDRDLDVALARWAAKDRGYDQMWSVLVQKYGPEPSASNSEDCMEAQQPDPTPTPPSPPRLDGGGTAEGTDEEEKASHRRRLRRFYAKYAPEKTDNAIEMALTRFGHGSGGGYERMWSTLVTKYGPEPTASIDDEENHTDCHPMEADL